MSGALAAIRALNAGFVLAGVFFGSGSVTLDSFTAVGLKDPEKMPFGGRQQIVTHNLLGGGRVFDLLGPDEADITFSGLLNGPQAPFRARQLDQIRQAGDLCHPRVAWRQPVGWFKGVSLQL